MPATNHLLEHVVAQLSNRRPNWPAVVELCRAFPRPGDFAQLAGTLAECHMRVALNEICAELDGRVNFYPIKDGATAEQFQFNYRGDNILAILNGTTRANTEIDALMTLDGLPVIFEVKISSGSWVEKVQYMMGVRSARKTDPVRQYFNLPDVGYVVIVPPSTISDTSEIQTKVKKDGWGIIPFFADRDAFREEVGRVRRNYHL